MKTIFFLIFSGCVIITSCKNSGQPDNGKSSKLPYMIDIEKNISNVKSCPLSSLGTSLEYIALETNPACMLSRISNVALSDSFVFVTDGTKLYKFDMSGKFLNQIGAAGRGPGEYTYVRDLIAGNGTRELYVLSSRMVLVYDFSGQYKRSFNTDFIPSQIIAKDQNSFMFHQFNISRPSVDTLYSWYVTDKQGVVLSKIKNNLKRISMPGLSVPNSPLYMYNETPHFLEYGIDTLYYFDKFLQEPYAVFNLGKIKMEPDLLLTDYKGMSARLKEQIWINDIRENDKLLLMKVSWGLSGSVSCITFDKKTFETTVLEKNGFINDLDGGMTFWPEKIIDDNILADYIDSFDLINFVNENQMSSEKVKDRKKPEQLNNLVKQLTETSNPVLVFLR